MYDVTYAYNTIYIHSYYNVLKMPNAIQKIIIGSSVQLGTKNNNKIKIIVKIIKKEKKIETERKTNLLMSTNTKSNDLHTPLIIY